MFELARGGGPFSAEIATIISVAIAVAFGFFLKRMIGPRGTPSTATEFGRNWSGWVAWVVCGTLLTPFVNFPTTDNFSRWIVGLVVFSAVGFAAGWAYRRMTFGTSASTAQTVAQPGIASRNFIQPSAPRIPSVQPATNTSPHTVEVIRRPGSQMNIDEDAIYEVVANEMESGRTDKGLWIRLFAEFDGDEKKSKIAYIKQRAEKLIAIERVRLLEQEQLRTEETARLEQLRTEGKSLRELVSPDKITPEMAEKIRSLSSSYGAAMFLNAVRLNQVEQVAKLIDENSFYVAIANSEGMSPLHISAAEGYVDMAKLLIQKGAPIDTRDMYGQAPLDIAKKGNRQQLISLISAMG